MQSACVGKKVIQHETCILIFSTAFLWNISHSEKNSARYYHKFTWVFMQSTLYSCQICNETWIFIADFRKRLKCQISWKFNQRQPKCSMRKDGRTDRQTDVTKLTVAFRNFANAPKNTYTYYTDLFLKETIIVSRTKIVIRYFISRRL
jgi:hypothetical protein